MKKLCIFDFDGTLFDSVSDVVECFNMTLEIHNLPTLTRDEYLECLGGNIDEIISLVLKDNDTCEIHEKVKKTYLDLYNSSKKEATVPFPHAHETLRELQEMGMLLALNSNRLSYSLRYFTDLFFQDIDFVLIEGHDPDFPSKPNPYGVNRIIRKADVTPEEAVYIGDSKTDIATAKNAGIDCIIVKWGYGNSADWENDYVLAAVDEFSQMLNYF